MNMAYKNITLPLGEEDISALKAGDIVNISGIAYMARDAAHKRLTDMINKGQDLPFDIKNACIYYAGPCEKAPGEIIGPCGPTTSSRMDCYTPKLIEMGLTCMIGKGRRADYVKQAMYKKALYLILTGGAGLFISRHITKAETIAFNDLGAEAIQKITFNALPAVVAIDSNLGDVFGGNAGL